MTAQIKKQLYQIIGSLALVYLLLSCSKNKIEATETYPPAPTVLVKFLDGGPTPSIGSEGSVVKFNVSGLKGKLGQFKFFINQMESEVLAADETSVTIKIPVGASSGGSAVLVNGEYYFGPSFTVKGKVSIDASFNTDAYGSNGSINGIIKRSDNTSYLVYGAFSNYQSMATEANPVTSMALIDLNCSYLAVANQLKNGKKGVGGSLSSVLQLPSGQYMLGGSFGSYDTVGSINNITRLTSTGALETQVVDVVNLDPVNYPNDGQASVPSFNGGTQGGIIKMFYNNTTGKTIVVGNFSAHLSTFYERSTKTSPYIDIVKVRQLIRMNSNGSFDSTFNFNMSTSEGYPVGNGFVYDAVQQPDGKIVIVGNFTTFNGNTVNYITRINEATGLPDPTFNQGGSGADGSINKITINTTTGKMLITGNFKTYNGQPANGVALLNNDGTADASFRFGKLLNGNPTFAGQLNNGLIMVAGTFSKYNYNYLSQPDNFIVRPGFMILDATGALAAGYNNTGLFRGTINDFIQITINGTPGVILVGNFDRFDNKTVADIVKLKIEN